jgi:hypothetical protein
MDKSVVANSGNVAKKQILQLKWWKYRIDWRWRFTHTQRTNILSKNMNNNNAIIIIPGAIFWFLMYLY